MVIDLFLYAALGGGWVAGRLVHWRSPWVWRATWATVGVLVFLLGASLAALPLGQLLVAIPTSFAIVGLVIGATLLCFFLLNRSNTPPPTEPRPPMSNLPAAPLLLVALVAGYLTLGQVHVSTAGYLDDALYALLILVAFDLHISPKDLRRVWIPLSAAVVGAVAAAGIAIVALDLSPAAALATTLGFGWYSLAGPLVSAQLGPAVGLVAFLANFLREDLTMLLAPGIARRFPGGGLAAVGGASSMDTTLQFSVAYDPPSGGTLALGTGFVLTVAASLLLPLILAVVKP